MYHQFNIQQFYVLPTLCTYVFCVNLRTAIFSPFNLTWLAFITSIYPFKAQWSLYVPTVENSSILRSAHTVYLFVSCESENRDLFPFQDYPSGFYNRYLPL